MRYLILSDIHANLEAFEAVLAAARPMLTVAGIASPSLRAAVSAKRRAMLCPTRRDSSPLILGSRIANSSPPSRALMAEGPAISRAISANR